MSQGAAVLQATPTTTGLAKHETSTRKLPVTVAVAANATGHSSRVTIHAQTLSSSAAITGETKMTKVGAKEEQMMLPATSNTSTNSERSDDEGLAATPSESIYSWTDLGAENRSGSGSGCLLAEEEKIEEKIEEEVEEKELCDYVSIAAFECKGREEAGAASHLAAEGSAEACEDIGFTGFTSTPTSAPVAQSEAGPTSLEEATKNDESGLHRYCGRFGLAAHRLSEDEDEVPTGAGDRVAEDAEDFMTVLPASQWEILKADLELKERQLAAYHCRNAAVPRQVTTSKAAHVAAEATGEVEEDRRFWRGMRKWRKEQRRVQPVADGVEAALREAVEMAKVALLHESHEAEQA